jgi:pimeloyl-ACP methyl ester carboxylesterase
MALGKYLQTIKTDSLHLVAHSMGGLVILKLFELSLVPQGPLAGVAQGLPPGRIVLTGSPVRGSRSAERLAQLPFGRTLLGLSASDMLLTPREPRWQGGRDLGVIAGDLAVGLGRLLGRMGAPNDGTVWLDETDLPGAAEQLRVRVSHSGMVFSAEVARQVAAFLRDGRFEPRLIAR